MKLRSPPDLIKTRSSTVGCSLTCASISCRLIWVRVMLEKSIVSRKDQHKFFVVVVFFFSPFFFKVAGNRKLKLTCLFNLGLPRLSGGHDGRGGLCDAAGRLLQAVQLGAVFVCFYLQKESSNNARDVKSLTSFPRVYC